MAEFTEVWENWKQICQYQRDLGEGSCTYCPLRKLECNSKLPKDQIHYDGKAVEEIIAKWVVDHPEPVYPTWLEWMQDNGFIQPLIFDANRYSDVECWFPGITARNPIPADIAEKLGLKPKG